MTEPIPAGRDVESADDSVELSLRDPVSRLGLRLPSPIVELDDRRLRRHGVRLWLKRDDLIHPELPGNKWRKLELNLAAAARQGHRTLLTFGGAYSNHILATAAAGRHFGFHTIGIIRGEEHDPLNPVLGTARDRGMRLHYMDRTRYRTKHEPATLAALREEFGDCYLLPEGGSNPLAVRGCAGLVAELNAQVATDVICCPVGSGGTLAGIAGGLLPGQRALGVCVLKGRDFLDRVVTDLQVQTYRRPRGDWRIQYDFDHGGYAKRSDALLAFMADFEARHGLRLERVYVAKLLYALYALVDRGEFAPGSRLAAIVTGAAVE